MPITTRTITKGIPPRLHEPKSTAKTANKGISKVKQTRKQVASMSQPASDAEDSEPARKKGRDKKQQHIAVLVDQRLRLSQSMKMLSQLRRKLRKKMPTVMVDKMIKKRSVWIPGHMQQLTELLGGWPQWTSAWAWPPRTADEEGYNTWPIDDDVWPSHCQIQASGG